MDYDITAILCAYNRPDYLQEQIEAIKAQTIPPKDIMLWYNKGEKEQIETEIEKSVYCNYNFKFFGRFAFAFMAQTKYVAIFDDDSIPGNQWFQNCLSCMEKEEGIMGSAGVILHGDYYHPHTKVGWQVNTPAFQEVDLVGHAWFLKKEWLKYMWMEEPFSYENGEDIHLSYTAQKYGGIQTFTPPQPEGYDNLNGSYKGMTYGNDAMSSHKRSNHGALRNDIVKNAVDNGWKPLYTMER